MGGSIQIVKVRDGVEFVPDAAKAFQRAEAEVQERFGRPIGVNSTYRPWNQQLSMFNAWNAYANGTGPYPGHSKAVHPSQSFHVSGLAMDSSDWGNSIILSILAKNGFIRNRLYVPNEQHHFEYDRSKDKNYGKEIDMPLSSDDVKRIADYMWKTTPSSVIKRIATQVWRHGKRGAKADAVYDSIRQGKKGVRTTGDGMANLQSRLGRVEILLEKLIADKTK